MLNKKTINQHIKINIKSQEKRLIINHMLKINKKIDKFLFSKKSIFIAISNTIKRILMLNFLICSSRSLLHLSTIIHLQKEAIRHLVLTKSHNKIFKKENSKQSKNNQILRFI